MIAVNVNIDVIDNLVNSVVGKLARTEADESRLSKRLRLRLDCSVTGRLVWQKAAPSGYQLNKAQ